MIWKFNNTMGNLRFSKYEFNFSIITKFQSDILSQCTQLRGANVILRAGRQGSWLDNWLTDVYIDEMNKYKALNLPIN